MKPTWKTWSILILACLGILFVLDARMNVTASSASENGLTFTVSDPVVPVLSRPVRELASDRVEPYLAREVNPIQWLGEGVGEEGPSIGPDPLISRSINGGTSPDPLVTFEGIPSLSGVTPPDTNGDVGPNHYVQMTNFSFRIWNKGDPNNGIPPTPLIPATLVGALFAPLGGQCTSNFGDPVVLYDDLADRWLLSQFGLSSPLGMCIAISQTADPTGAYYLYFFPTPDFPDYPKLGVWPDAYYMGTNTGFPNQYFAHAFNRVAMLSGSPATLQSFGGLANLMMPADVDGQVPPPAGAPGIFYTFYHPSATGHPSGPERLAFYHFNVDWGTPSNSSYTLAAELPIAAFNYTICGFFAGGCIPQPGTGQLLDDIAWWPMFRMQYRNFGGYASMVGNFTVDADGANHAGIRWFEVRKTGNTYSLFQEGTQFPNTDSRWMGSIAMDRSGNIALGYSVSSSTTIPSIRYATRLAGDIPGTLSAEAEMWTGVGVQTGIHRWGDYSNMAVDPVDGCTFWYTTEYHDTNDQGFGWNTRVGVFRIPTCGGDTGKLTGEVTDSSTTLPIPGVSIYATASPTMTGFTTTNASGVYTVTLIEGTYDVTASVFGYLPEIVNGVNIVSGTVTTQDFALDPAPTTTFEGYVTDALMDWPLYARVDIEGYPGNPVWTDPVTGYFSVTLPVGTYEVTVDAFIPGYVPTTTEVVLSAPPILLAPSPETINLAGTGVPEKTGAPTPHNTPMDPASVQGGGIVSDPGFEAGTPNPVWTEFSTNFGSPLCTIAFCGTGTGTGPHSGTWWSWFGGISAYEEGSVAQTVIIPNGSATLSFYLEQIVCAAPADYMEVLIDGNQVFLTTGASPLCGQLGYSLQTVDISAYADGGSHTLEFHSEIFGSGNTNIFIDDISITSVAAGFNFPLQANLNACEAPGYTPVPSGGFFDNFESGLGNWTLTGLWNAENQTDVCGAIVAPFPSPTNAVYYGQNGVCNFDVGANSGTLTLNSPVSVGAGSVLTFSTFEQTECNGPACPYDARNVQVSTNGGSSWNTIYTGGAENTWRQETLNLSPFAGSVLVRFQFDSLDSIGNNFFGWMVDDVSIDTYTCVPPTEGGLVVGNVYDVNTSNPVNGAWITNNTGELAYAVQTPLDPAVDDAFYTIYSLAGTEVHTATYTLYGEDVQAVGVVDFDTVEQDFYLPSGFIVLTPTAFDVTLEIGTNTTLPLDLTDTGGANVEFEIREQAGSNPYAPAGISIPASDGNFQRGAGPVSVGPAPIVKVLGAPPQATLEQLLGSNAYGYEHTNLFYTIFDVDIPEVLPNVAPNPNPGANFIGAGEYLNGMVYMVDTGNVMWEVDAATGTILNTYTATAPPGGETYSGLALDPTSGVLYAASTSISGSTLLTMDAPSGAATVVGPISGFPCIIAIAADGNGALWGYDICTDVLVSIDKSTGAGTQIGSIGFDANFGQGMGWDPATDTLYMAAFNNGAFQAELRAVDRTTGNTTLVGALGATTPGGTTQVSWLGFEISGGADVPWVSETPITGTVPANNNLIVDVTFDAAQVPIPGQYTAFLKIAVDTPQLELTVPLTLNVTCSTCGTLQGDITDAATSLPLVSSIRITNTLGFDFTLEDFSSYSIQLQPGPYTVIASATGYLSDTATVNITTGNTTTQDFALWANTSILSFSPDSVEEFMDIGDVVTNTVTVTNSGAAPLEYEVRIGGYSGPVLAIPRQTTIHIPHSDGTFPRGDAAPSFLASPTHEKVNNPAADVPQPFLLGGGAPAYGAEFFSDQFLTFMTDAPGTVTNISSMGGALYFAGDFIDGDFTTLYAVDFNTNNLYAIDTATGVPTLIGPMPPASGGTWTGMAGDPTSGTMYASSTPDCNTNTFYTVDLETGAVTQIATTSGYCIIDIAINSAGDMYGHDIVGDQLVAINKDTGVITSIGSTGFDANFAQGMDFDEEADVLYLAAYNNATSTGELRIADLNTGSTALVGNIGSPPTELDAFAVATGGGGAGGWAYAVPNAGTVPPFSATTFDLVFDARSLYQVGDYFATLSFRGNFVNDPGTMPLTMHVSCPSCGFLVGDIYDAFTTAPVNADILVTGPGGVTITLTNLSSYNLALQPGTYDFLVTADGYFSETASVTAVQGQTVETDFALTPIIGILEYSPSSFEQTVALGSVFTETFWISSTGTAGFDFYLEDVELGRPGILAPFTTCAEDLFGYTCTDSNEPGGPAYNFEDISATGSLVFLSDDEVSGAIPLGFIFDFYEVDYNNVYISSNGFLTFLPGQSNGCCTGQPIPTPGDPDGLVAGWWEDLYPPGGGTIHYQTLGTVPNRVFIVQFTNIPHFSSGNLVTFQYKLFENSDQIEIHYQAAPSDGGTHSVGIENENGTVGLQYYLGPSGLATPLAVRFGRAVDAPWLLESPEAGYIAAGSSEMIYLIYDATVVTQTGTYTAELRFDGTFDNAVAPAQVVMHVVEAEPGVEMGSASGAGPIGAVVTHTVWVTNTGNLVDTFDLTATGNAWPTALSASHITLYPGASGYILVSVTIPNSANIGDVDTVLCTATSRFDTSVSSTGTVQTTAAEYGVVVEADQAQEGFPGTLVTYSLTVMNTGSVADTYNLTVSGNTWTTTPALPSVTVAAGATVTVQVTVAIPASAAHGDVDVATVTATSQGDPTQADSVTLTTTAITTYELNLPLIFKN